MKMRQLMLATLLIVSFTPLAVGRTLLSHVVRIGGEDGLDMVNDVLDLFNDTRDGLDIENDLGGRHLYLRGEFYAQISGLDLKRDSEGVRNWGNEGHHPSIQVVEASAGFCDEVKRWVTFEFVLRDKRFDGFTTYAELVFELEKPEDGDAFLASSVFGHQVAPGGTGVPGAGGGRLVRGGMAKRRNRWLVYDVSEILRSFEGEEEKKMVTFMVDLSGRRAFTWNDTNLEGVHGCGDLAEKAPVLFLYQDFPPELGERLRGSEERKRRPPAKRSVSGHRTDQSSECHLHQWTVDFNTIGLKWVIAPANFKVNYCHGVCNDLSWNTADLRERQLDRVTNHALLLIRAQASTAALPSPTCVPTAYDAMNMIYLDRHNVVRVATFSQMIATSCGCE